jgi:peptide subunit release factor 1 (eRF1)
MYCVRKHLSQAIVLNIESHLGYPIHKWLAIGHLAEASTESLKGFPELSAKIRQAYLDLMDNKEVDLMGLLNEANELVKDEESAKQQNIQKEEKGEI